MYDEGISPEQEIGGRTSISVCRPHVVAGVLSFNPFFVVLKKLDGPSPREFEKAEVASPDEETEVRASLKRVRVTRRSGCTLNIVRHIVRDEEHRLLTSVSRSGTNATTSDRALRESQRERSLEQAYWQRTEKVHRVSTDAWA